MEAHDLKPLARRLSPRRLATRAARIEARFRTVRYSPAPVSFSTFAGWWRDRVLDERRFARDRRRQRTGHTHAGERARRQRARERRSGAAAAT